VIMVASILSDLLAKWDHLATIVTTVTDVQLIKTEC
jgi:hypothetical protein